MINFENIRNSIKTRDDIKLDIIKIVSFYFFWSTVLISILISIPPRAWEFKLHGFFAAIAIIGIWRYSWFIINTSNGLYYKHIYFPKIFKKVYKNPKFPKRVFILVPSYKEDYKISRLTFKYLVQESYKIPSQVYFYISVATHEEVQRINEIIKIYDTAKKIKVTFLFQSQGKRVALAHGLRAIAREYFKPTAYHEDAKNDVIIMMDGDSVVGKNALYKTLAYFRKYPKLGALTTDELVYYYGEGVEYLKKWYELKFVKRHIMMSAHSLHKKVLTLTGRFSVFRAHIILTEEFISHVANDQLSHWLFGKFRFLMGDDKSTWFHLLKEGWDMLYIPNVLVFSLENRKGNFFKISIQLMFRWYGNMLRNNTRALKLGPKKIGSFYIWYAILDQRISMWTSIFGPVVATLLSIYYTWFFWAFYIAWVIFVRMIQFIPIIKEKFNPDLIHLPLLVYDQWIGSIVKIYASFHLSKQKWSKGGEKSTITVEFQTFKLIRKWMPTFIFLLFVIAYIVFAGIYANIFHPF
jgi:glycosyltransferase Alg8